MGYILAILGALLVLEGIPYFAFPAKAKRWATQVQEVPDRVLRIIGAASMITGLLLLYAKRLLWG